MQSFKSAVVAVIMLLAIVAFAHGVYWDAKAARDPAAGHADAVAKKD